MSTPIGKAENPLLLILGVILRTFKCKVKEENPGKVAPLFYRQDLLPLSFISRSGQVFDDMSVGKRGPDISQTIRRHSFGNGGEGILVAGG
jgi:hypothetical protein